MDYKKEIKKVCEDKEEFDVLYADYLIHDYFETNNKHKQNEEYTKQEEEEEYKYTEFVFNTCKRILKGEL